MAILEFKYPTVIGFVDGHRTKSPWSNRLDPIRKADGRNGLCPVIPCAHGFDATGIFAHSSRKHAAMLPAGLAIVGNHAENFGRKRIQMKTKAEIRESSATYHAVGIEAWISTSIRSDGSAIQS